jgi:hypothetical protein
MSVKIRATPDKGEFISAREARTSPFSMARLG